MRDAGRWRRCRWYPWPLTLKRVLNTVFVLVALATVGLVARHFARTGWPLHRANLWLVGVAALIFVGAYAAKAWGWQRLFSDEQRPAVLLNPSSPLSALF